MAGAESDGEIRAIDTYAICCNYESPTLRSCEKNSSLKDILLIAILIQKVLPSFYFGNEKGVGKLKS
ncbi:hypothetical protein A8F94_16440 [Bacillus sp. FJAT-27225]|nr:hypothetical protein A8F94_16440 [Bacillus sp. FJAT-27225]